MGFVIKNASKYVALGKFFFIKTGCNAQIEHSSGAIFLVKPKWEFWCKWKLPNIFHWPKEKKKIILWKPSYKLYAYLVKKNIEISYVKFT